jgi:uncharacterized protein YecE (DUF72 family)
MASHIRIGTAGWSIPRGVADRFPAEGSGIERYAARLDAAEINTSFYRPHRRATYERWAASVPADFRFSFKLPKAITHVARLRDSVPLLAQFAEEIAGLGAKRGPMLVQLPPSLTFEADVAASFFADLTRIVGGSAVCEPRHASWFGREAEAFLAEYKVARVAADPAPVPAAASPGGWQGLAYIRLHGSPRIYWSGYDAPERAEWMRRAARLATTAAEVWVIFDNTASGRAASDALAFREEAAPLRR